MAVPEATRSADAGAEDEDCEEIEDSFEEVMPACLPHARTQSRSTLIAPPPLSLCPTAAGQGRATAPA
eukprot:COSAG01_NODE_9936_length_2298_cov_1.992724_4_plen_68_part_00